VTDLM